MLFPGLGKAGGSSFLHPVECLANNVFARARKRSNVKCMGISIGGYASTGSDLMDSRW